MPIAIAVLLAAISFALLVLVVAAEGLARMTKKPHYGELGGQWARALAVVVGAAVVHAVVVGLVTRTAGRPGLVETMGSALWRDAYGYAVTGCIVVGLAVAGAYARALVRFPDDYVSRSAFRISAMVALIGLIGLPLARDVTTLAVGGTILVAFAVVMAITWLWHGYAREPTWLLRAFVALAPLGVLAILAIRPLGPVAALANGARGAIVAVDVLLVVVAAWLAQRIARRRIDVRSLAAFTMEASRHGGR